MAGRWFWILMLASCGPERPAGGSDQGGSSSSDAGTTSTATSSTGPTSTASTTTEESTGTSGEPMSCSADDAFVQVTEPCADGVELQQHEDAGPTGLAACADGSIHSYGIACCGGDPTLPCTGPDGMCQVDGDCVVGSNGVCRSFFPGDFCLCLYGYCTTDADCFDGKACVCASPDLPRMASARCLDAHCRTDSDCGDQQCGLSRDDCGNPMELRCHTPQDECHGPDDCPGNFDICVYRNDSGRWVCHTPPPCE